MEEKQTIAACGAGSISKRNHPDGRIVRSDNVKDVTRFIPGNDAPGTDGRSAGRSPHYMIVTVHSVTSNT